MSSDGDFETGILKQVKVRPRRKASEQSATKQLPPYTVILHNDDFNTVDFVIGVIIKVFHYPVEKAVAHTLEAHQTGRSIVWSGSAVLIRKPENVALSPCRFQLKHSNYALAEKAQSHESGCLDNVLPSAN